MKKVVAVVEARMGSSRLPGKSLKEIEGVALAERVLRRVRESRSVDEVVLATSVGDLDTPLAEKAKAAGFAVYRGSELDVLDRILGASTLHESTIHVQCWGDCPFVDPDQIDLVVHRLHESDVDLVGNNTGGKRPRELPYGLDVIALRTDALRAADAATRDNPYHREHGTTYLYESGLFKTECLAAAPEIAIPSLDLTINTAKDFEFVCAVHAALAKDFGEKKLTAFRIRDVLRVLRSDEALLAHPNAQGVA